MPSDCSFNRTDDRLFLAYLVAFFAAWTIYVLLIYPHVRALGETSLLYALAGIGIRLLVWIVPVIACITLADHANPLHYLKPVDRWRTGILVGLALAAVTFTLSALRFGWPHVARSSVT